MSKLFEQYKTWREMTDAQTESQDDFSDYGDKMAFRKNAKIKKLEDDDFE